MIGWDLTLRPTLYQSRLPTRIVMGPTREKITLKGYY